MLTPDESFHGAYRAIGRHLLAVVIGVLCCGALSPAHADAYNYSRSSSFTYYGASDGVKNGLLKSETVEGGNAQLCVTTTYTYDGYGNKDSAVTANCAGATGQAVVTARTTSNTFAAVTSQPISVNGATVNVAVKAGMFANSTTNALNQKETHTFDPRFGAMLQMTGPNGLTTSWAVDDFGRKVRERSADGTSTVIQYCVLATSLLDTSSNSAGCATPSAGEAPADAVMFVQTEPRNTSDVKMGPFVRVYKDRLGRDIRTVTQSFDGAGQTAQRAGVLVAKDTIFGPYGATRIETEPYFLTSKSSTTNGSNDVGLKMYEVDANGRPIKTYGTDPMGSQASITFGSWGARQAALLSTTYTALKVTRKNDKGQQSTEEQNVNGQVVRVTDASGAQLVHQHDAFGNLVATKDALQNTISVSFDVRGRKTQISDPDAGVTKYVYDALGQLVTQQNAKQIAAGTQTMMTYDVLGRLLTRTDPEYASTWTYDKYADNSACSKGVGKLCEVNTSHGVRRKFVYDSLGRAFNTRFSVDNGPAMATAVSYEAATGRLSSQTYPTGVKVNYAYTSGLGFLDSMTLGTPVSISPLPASVGGTAAAGKNLAAGSMLWQAKVVSAWGRTEQQSLGNGVNARTTFDPGTGRLTAAQAGPGATATVLSHSYGWDSLGNPTQRNDANGDGTTGSVTDSFTYDSQVNRLVSYTVSAPQIPNLFRKVSMTYNAVGMLLYKSDVGNYSYPAAGSAVRPHTLQSVSGAVSTAFSYDGNGNLASADAGKYRSVSYTSFNLPDAQYGIAGMANTPRYTWQYDENHARIKETRAISGGTLAGTRITWSLHPNNEGGLGFEYEINTPSLASPSNPAVSSNRHYLSAGGQTIGVLVSTGALPTLTATQTAPPAPVLVAGYFKTVKLEYWHKDHLGSLAATTDHNGAVTVRYSYDPFGKRRYTNGSYDAFGTLVIDWSPAVNNGDDRGYTGHEHLDSVGLIHMNGRLFDPTLGIFLQADPLIQDALNLQNYNRYGYCYNNPLGCTDPSGLSFLSRLFHATHKLMRNPFSMRNAFNFIHAQPLQPTIDRYVTTHRWAYTVGSIAASIYGGPYGSAFASAYYTYAVTGSPSAAKKAGAVTYLTAQAFNAVGTAFPVASNATTSAIVQNAVGHAVVGCLSAAANGGKCGAGALSAGFSAATGNFIPQLQNLPGQVLIGGASSVLGGGKFEDGALTAAMGYLFNCLAHECNGAKYDSKDPNFHEYGPFASSICDTAAAGCLDAARQQLLCNSAPGAGQCAVVGQTVPQGLSGGNPITQYAPSRDMVINGTSPGHVFDDGYVVRWLSVNDAGIAQIWTYGRGVNTNFLTTFGNQYGGIGIFKYIGIRNSAEANRQIKKDGNGP